MNVLVVAAHPDDEILGAGGTILRLAREGHKVTVLTMSMKSVTREADLESGQKKTEGFVCVSERINCDYEAMRFLDYNRHDMVQRIENAIVKCEPDAIISHFHGDIHNDHRVTAELVEEAARLPQRMGAYKKRIARLYAMEVASSTDWAYREAFRPNFFVQVEEADIKAKAQALSCYGDVTRPVPHPRNEETLLALARHRGAMCGAKYAEAFQLIFGID